MEEHKSQKMLWVVLGFLCVSIVGLVVGIVVVGSNGSEEDSYLYDDENTEYNITNNTQVVARCNEINSYYNVGSNHNLEETITKFEDSISESARIQKMYMSICYARFINDEEGDLKKAVEILDKFQKMADSEGGEVTIDYYVAMRGIYETAGDEEKANYYNEKVIQLVPDVVIDLDAEEEKIDYENESEDVEVDIEYDE